MFSECYCTQFRRSANALTGIYDQELKSVGLKVTQLTLLRAIDQVGAPTFNEVAIAVGLNTSTISRNLKLLIDAGWVKVSGDADARVKVAALTVSGSRMLKKAEPHWRRAQEQVEALMSQHLNAAGKAALGAALEAMPSVASETHDA